MLRTWLRRWLSLEAHSTHPGAPVSGLERRVDELEQHVDFLHGALRKLRGRVTGAIRHPEPDPDGNGGDPVSDAHAAVPTSGITRQWELAQLEHLGRAVKPQ